MTTISVDPELLQRPRVQGLLARSALYEALGLMLAYPRAEALARADALLADANGHPLVLERGHDPLVRRLRAAGRELTADRLAPVHFMLFEGSVLCSPHETEYIRDPLAKGAQLADIAGFYAAFGLQVSRTHPATPDEITAECEFMSYITRKEAYALLREWTDQAAIAHQAGSKFLETHPGRWIDAFAADLCARADEAAALRDDPAVALWFHALGDLVRAVVNADLAQLSLYPSRLSTRYADPEADSFACPMAAGALSDDTREEDIETTLRATQPHLPPD